MDCPLISRIQRIIIYETKARYYVVGSNDTQTAFRVLKIDRTEPKELHIQDDRHVYNQQEFENLLTMIDAGNRACNSKQKHGLGIIRTVCAYGIVGFVRFLEGYYMIVVTQRTKTAMLGGHTVYKIEDTSMLYIPNLPSDNSKFTHNDELKYVKLFQSVDLSSNFYFSYSYDLTHTLQYNMTPSKKPGSSPESGSKYGVRMGPEWRFVWNKYLLTQFQDEVHSDWILHFIYGFVAQSNLHIYGKPVFITLIARRSNEYAGTRFLKRGANTQGAVANEVETEQIVYDASVTNLDKTKVSSYVQLRGSIPIFWSQDVSKMVPKPQIAIDQRDPYFYTAGLHFNKCLRRCGAPIILLNLIKRKERRQQESLLKEEYVNCKDYLNQFLPPDHRILYLGFDMARYSKSAKRKNSNVLERLAAISIKCLKRTGFFFHSPNMLQDLWTQPEFEGMKGHKLGTGLKQTGVVRTNCVDCLDRTNTAQFALGKCALEYQLCALGVLASPDLDFDTDCLKILEELYEAQGDTVALQYGGSQLVHRIEGYRKIAPFKSHSNDILQTLSRYYSNTFSDVEKQQATNVFLGLFVPKQYQLNIWDLTTDFYLHNTDAVLYRVPRRSYTCWCEPGVFDHLPLPYDEGCKEKNTSVHEVLADGDERIDIFSEFYRPKELTKLDDHFAIRFLLPKSSKTPLSPFKKLADSRETRESSQEANPSISGKDSTASMRSNTSEEGSSTSCSSVDGDLQSSDDDNDELVNNQTTESSPDSDNNLYGLDLSKFERDESTQDIYDKYVSFGFLCEDTTSDNGEGKLEDPSIQDPKPKEWYQTWPSASAPTWRQYGQPHNVSPKRATSTLSRDENSSVLLEKSKAMKKASTMKPTLQLEPLDDYRSDIYCVEQPSVSTHSIGIYRQYVQRGLYGASEPAEANKEMYRKYVRQLYR